MGNSFKLIIQQLAGRISVRKNKPYSIVVNRIRSKIIAVLMKQNAIMILSSITL